MNVVVENVNITLSLVEIVFVPKNIECCVLVEKAVVKTCSHGRSV